MNVLNSKKSRLIFWGGWALSWIISGLSFFPISKLDSVFFPAQTNMAPAKWFPQPSTNFIMLWAVFNGIVGVILFWISCRISGKEQGRKIDFSDIKIGILPLVKTIALALCIFADFTDLYLYRNTFLIQTIVSGSWAYARLHRIS